MGAPAHKGSGVGWPTWAGLTAVGAAAAILTFTTLTDLAGDCGMVDQLGPLSLAWLLPISVDAAGAVATAVWLLGRTSDEATRFARGLAWSAVVCSITGNAAEHGMRALHIAPPWWVVVLVSAVPPCAFGAVVHLAVLVARGGPDQPDQPGPQPDRPLVDSSASDEDILADLRKWVVQLPDQPSRNAVISRYGIGATRAGRLLAELAGADR